MKLTHGGDGKVVKSGPKKPGPRSAARRKKSPVTTVEHTPPPAARFTYQIQNGYGFACDIKNLGISHSEGNLRFDERGIHFTRTSDCKTILNRFFLDAAKVQLLGDFNRPESEGKLVFYFGFKISELIQRTTHSIRRNDSLMLYFEENAERMFAEQLMPSTLLTSRSMIQWRDIQEQPFYDIDVGDPSAPQLSIRTHLFCRDCALLPSAKAQTVTIYCGDRGMAMVGRGADGEPIKSIFFAVSGRFSDTENMDYTINNAEVEATIMTKKFKTIVNFRNISTSKEFVKVHYERGKPILFMTNYLGVGWRKVYMRNMQIAPNSN
jgi:hypothetical protein